MLQLLWYAPDIVSHVVAEGLLYVRLKKGRMLMRYFCTIISLIIFHYPLYHCNLNIFGCWSVVWTKEAI